MYAAADNPESRRSQARLTITSFEQRGVAVFPGRLRRKGSYVEQWPSMAPDSAIAITKRALELHDVNIAGRSGEGVAVIDLDAKNGVEPAEMLPVLRRLLGPAIIAIVCTSRGFHLWVQVAEPVGNGFCSFVGGEIFSGAHLAMLPPSIHPDGHQYTWDLPPREPEAAVNLKALGLVPDKPDRSTPHSRESALTPAGQEVQEEFARLMADAGVRRIGTGSQTLALCPWHDDRSPSLSINWDGAVFYCFSEHCGARGGIGSLRRRVHGDTPTYRQWPSDDDTHERLIEEDEFSGDKLGCAEMDAATERLSIALETLASSERAQAVRECRAFFRVGKCSSCARTPAFPISCGHPLCVRCMPGRLAADWQRHRASMPSRVHILLLQPRDAPAGSFSVLRTVRARFAEWRKRAGVSAGIYGSRLDREHGATIMLAIPNGLPIPASSRAFDVQVVALNRTPNEFLGWLQSQYVTESQLWSTLDELEALMNETKGRRRFQGFGGIYGERAQDNKEDDEMAQDGNAQAEKRPLGRISGGSAKGDREKADHSCPFCGGVVELYPFTVPASEVERSGRHWAWRGPAAGAPEGRRYAR